MPVENSVQRTTKRLCTTAKKSSVHAEQGLRKSWPIRSHLCFEVQRTLRQCSPYSSPFSHVFSPHGSSGQENDAHYDVLAKRC